ncbi:MAG TPA: glycosyltransferase family 4 protein [Xanthobacteraceae bacterium]|nr:glycosyltransferase family 4 protein [Xanthobacteraceae bacterium]
MNWSRPGRILMTTDTIGGVWTYATSLARRLCREGCEVSLVTLGPAPRDAAIRALATIRGLDLTVTDLALEWMDPEGRDLARAIAELHRIEDRARPELIHLNSYREALGVWRAPVLIAAHSCVRSWWRACRSTDPDEPRWSRYVANARAGLSAADRWVAPTKSFRDVIQQLYRPPTPGQVIPNGLEIDAVCRDAEKEPIILASGRLWDEAKNVSLLAGIAPELPWPMRMAGPMRAPEAHSAWLPRTDNISFLGELTRGDLMTEMRCAAVFAAPALYEPFGLSVLEAAACGCALVLSDIDSFRELWDGAALFVDPRDPTAWQDILTRLANDGDLRHELQQRAASRAARYTLNNSGRAYRKLYAAMLERRPARPRQTAHQARHEVRP